MDIVLCYTLNDVWELNVLFLYKKNKKFILDLLFNIYARTFLPLNPISCEVKVR